MTQRDARALLAALAGLLLAVCAVPAWAQDPRAERPTYQVGDKWIRSDGTYTLTRIDKGVYVFATGSGNEIHLNKDLAVIRIVLDRRTELDIDAMQLRWPLEVGRQGYAVGAWNSPPRFPTSAWGGRVRIAWRIDAFEDVRLTVGTFKALRIVTQVHADAVGGILQMREFALWYAPDLRQYVKGEGNQPGLSFELTGVDKPAASPVIAERPTYQIGDTWIRTDGTYELRRIDKDVYVFTAGVGKEFHLTKDLGVTRIVLDGRAVYDVNLPVGIKWPLAMGKWSSTRAYWRAPLPRPLNIFSGPINVVWRVDGYEDVTLASGRFKAFRIAQEIDVVSPTSGAGLQLGQFSLWYASSVQRFVKAQGDLPGLNWELAGTEKPGAPPVIATPPPTVPPTVTTPPTAPPPTPAVVAPLPPPVPRTPPTIVLLDPKPGTLIRAANAKLKVEVKSPYRLNALRVGKEGESAEQTFAPRATVKPGETWTVDVFVFLGEGDNKLRFEAVDEDGTRAEQTVTLTRQSLVALELRGPPGAQVKVNDRAYALDAQGALALELAPGTHQIDARKEGFTSARETVTLAPGQTPTQKWLALTPLPPPPPTVAAPPPDTEAPRIAINYPPPDTKVDRESIVVTGLVTDNVSVDRVQVAVNGVEVPQPRDIGVVGRGVPIRVAAALQPGDNVIEITAADKAGNVAQVVRTVTRVAPAVAGPPAPKVANRWAVVIGVSEYDNRQVPRLRYAVRDADAMYQFLTTQGGYAKERVLLLTDTSATKPTLLNIKRALGDFLARRAARDDMVLIYFAGHGAPEVDVAGAEADGLSKYLVPRDGDPESLYTTALPMDEVQRIFARIPAERVVMLLDTCYSGSAGGRTFARATVRASGLNDQFLERLTRSRGRVVITASGPNEVALELPKLGHGLFTYYVLEGLRGKADRNGDGIVTVSELYEYVEEQVDNAARLAGGRQRPLMKGDIEGTLPLSKASGR